MKLANQKGGLSDMNPKSWTDLGFILWQKKDRNSDVTRQSLNFVL